MKIHISTFLILLFVFVSQLGFGQAPLDSLANELKQADFQKVGIAGHIIINYQQQAIPVLIKLLKDTSYVQLINTNDLIYPGAKEFWGHGRILNYELNWISVRAGWLLEKITFHNFGYSTRTISEDSLMNIHKKDYANYLKKGYHDVDFSSKTPREQLIIYRSKLAIKVEKWWSKNKKTWTRFKAVKEALSGTNKELIFEAINYLQYQTTRCDGLSKETFESEIKPLLLIVPKVDPKEQYAIEEILKDKEYHWLKIKS